VLERSTHLSENSKLAISPRAMWRPLLLPSIFITTLWTLQLFIFAHSQLNASVRLALASHHVYGDCRLSNPHALVCHYSPSSLLWRRPSPQLVSITLSFRLLLHSIVLPGVPYLVFSVRIFASPSRSSSYASPSREAEERCPLVLEHSDHGQQAPAHLRSYA